MMIRGYEIGARLILAVVAVLLVVGLLTLRQCDKNRTAAMQNRIEAGQTGAAQETGRDAINTISNRAASDRASDDLSRSNADDIRNAPGAGDRVNSGVDLAGRKALCSRATYANDPRCKQFRETPR